MLPQHQHANKELGIIISVVDEFKQKGRISNPAVVTQLMKDSLQLPANDPFVDEIAANSFVILAFAEVIIRRSWHEGLLNEATHTNAAQLLYSQVLKLPVIVRVREFLPMELAGYYAFPFHFDDGFYDLPDDHPILVTRIQREWADETLWEINSRISRPELRILSALMFCVFSDHGPRFHFRLHHKFHDLPGNVLLDEAGSFREPAPERAQAAFRIMRSLELLDSPSARRHLLSEHFLYEFKTEGVYDSERVRIFYHRFDIEDNLSLRTAYLLIKSAMLWIDGNRIFEEDATANLFFGLEGCLRLIHSRAFGAKEFEIKRTLAHIEGQFPRTPGYVWMLEDAYAKRIQIAHPEPRTGLGWLPSLAADDFYENYGMAIDLFYYAITGDVLPPRD